MNATLFDCDGKASDQPGKFIQIDGVLPPDPLRKPDQALIVAHDGDVTGNDRRRCLYEIGLDVWHLVSSLANPALATRNFLGPSSRFSDQFAAPIGLEVTFWLPCKPPEGTVHSGALPQKNAGKSLWHNYFRPSIDATENPAIWCFASPGGFVIRSGLANDRFALFLGSSAVEHSTVNRMVAGSNPARGANTIKYLAQNCPLR
jgi:hypothetical protein